ncbi:MAG: DNA polymerase IV, partial [Opitutae bacterium]|nr:DNA polymerase IV [Opitutae bacterium]
MDWPKKFIHLDMDAFFAAVEQRDDPSLKGKPVIVGGNPNSRSVVSTCSYEARKFGVHSAMPTSQAKRLRPEAVFLYPDFEKYSAVSRTVMSIFHSYTPLVEQVSLDEAYLDVTENLLHLEDPVKLAALIKQHIFAATRLTASAGVAPAMFLAKIASDMQKPDGLTLIEGREVAAVIERLPIERVPGVGPAALARLAPRGIKTLADAGRLGEAALERRLGKFGRRLAALARGEDPSPVTPHSETKSISAEVTLARDTADPGEMKKILLDQAEDVARQLRHQGLRARTVVLKLKHDDFRQLTRSRTLEAPTQSAHTLFGAAAALLDAYRLRQPVRLVGVGAANLVPANRPVQTALF